MVTVFMFAGQSNMTQYAQMGILKDTTQGSPPYVAAFQINAANGPGNGWTGAATASCDSGVQYTYPTAALNPCLYTENVGGDFLNCVDGWGTFDKQSMLNTQQKITFAGAPTGGTFTLTYNGQTTAPITYPWNATASLIPVPLAANIKAGLEALSGIGKNGIEVANVTFSGSVAPGYLKFGYYGAVIGKSTLLVSADGSGLTGGSSPSVAISTTNLYGAFTVATQHGLELSFLAKYRAAHPTDTIACIKQGLGGTGLRNDWLPYSVPLGNAQTGGASSITLQSNDNGTALSYPNLFIKMLSGACTGQVQQILSFNPATKDAVVTPWTGGVTPSAGDSYGIERLQMQVLRTMLTQATARLNTTYGAGNWQFGGFIWMQGESGCHTSPNPADDNIYLSDARGLFAYVRSLTRTDLPVIVGRISDNWTSNSGTLAAAGYPNAAINASWQQNGHPPGNGHSFDGRVNNTPAQTILDYHNGTMARRATQIKLGSDPNCAWWDNDGYPIIPPFHPQHKAYWGVEVFLDGSAYHFSGPGCLAAGERAFAAYQGLLANKSRLRARVPGGGRLRIRGAA
jgi:hypothetical protein